MKKQLLITTLLFPSWLFTFLENFSEKMAKDRFIRDKNDSSLFVHEIFFEGNLDSYEKQIVVKKSDIKKYIKNDTFFISCLQDMQKYSKDHRIECFLQSKRSLLFSNIFNHESVLLIKTFGKNIHKIELQNITSTKHYGHDTITFFFDSSNYYDKEEKKKKSYQTVFSLIIPFLNSL